MAKIRQSNLDNSIVTGLGELTSVASGDQTIIYDASTGTLKKISQTNFLNFPTVSSVSPTSATSGDGTGNYTFTITGSGFTSGSADLINNSGTVVAFDTVTVDSDTQITGVIAKSSLSGSGEPYDVRVTSTNGLRGTLENQINIDQSPTFNTAAGSLGTVPNGAVGSTTLTVEAFDPESAGNVTFEIQSGSLPAGVSTTTVNENGVSKFQISGFSTVGSNTTSNFVLRAADANSNTSSRSFSITVLAPTSESFTSSGTFSVPSGVTSLSEVLVVAGGGGGGYAYHGAGGGAGGLIYMPGYPVTPGGTITVTVGSGGTSPHPNAPGSPGCNVGTAISIPGGPSNHGGQGQDSVFGSPSDPGLGSGGVLTAKGGGGGSVSGYLGGACGGISGGSGGGTKNFPEYPSSGGTATQPTQPGNSGAYGFGNAGGTLVGADVGWDGAGGGGGAGAVGSNGQNIAGGDGGPGGAGKSYTIADGTTPVYYAGGGGGSSPKCGFPGGGGTGGQGGQGGGGQGGPVSGASLPTVGTDGTANRGGGGGGSERSGPGANQGAAYGGSGGKGIVIVRY